MAQTKTITTKSESLHEALADDKTVFGFWVYLMTDLLMFGVLFATYSVLHGSVYNGPGSNQLFDLPFALSETLILLTSSFTCGLALLAALKKSKRFVLFWFGITFLLGLAFLYLELGEFGRFIAQGDSWRRSGFLSSYFTLVGTHGLHITVGLFWMSIAMINVWKKGLTGSMIRKVTLLSLFWHFLDIIWIFIFTIVYLMGVL
jgi:cytochrome o ubiquinol oxidase subunit III